MMQFSKDKDIQKTAKALVRDCGWSPKRGGSHVCLMQPGTGHKLAIPGSPSCPRAAMNWHAQVRRMIRQVGGKMPAAKGLAA